MLTQEYVIADHNIAILNDQIAALNKKARKLNVPAISYTIGSEPVKIDHDTWGNVKRAWYQVSVTGQAPKMAGWRLLAVLSPIETNGEVLNLVKEVPGSVCPAEYRNIVGVCTHCGTIRRRNETFVVQHDDGRTECVGRSCIKDFLGHADPHKYAAWATLIMTLTSISDRDPDEYWGTGPSPDPSFELVNFLAWTASVVDKDGWRSKASCQYGEQTPTCGTVCWLTGRPPVYDSKAMKEWQEGRVHYQPTDEHKEQAQNAVEWVKAVDPGDNNYLFNIKALGGSRIINIKNTGLAASIIQAYRKHLGKEVEKAAERKSLGASEFFGEIKKRAEYTLTLVKELTFESAWGTSYLERFLDATGNVAVWWASSCPEDMKVGETYRVKATVKDHTEYNGIKQTLLQRVKIV